MTQYSAIWVRCPKCYYSLLIDGAIFNNFLNDTCEIRHCKCGKDITKKIKENIEDYNRFTKLITSLNNCIKIGDFSSIDNEFDELYDLYDKVVIS